ncbi:MAG: YHS domain-containing protein [Nitrospirae bacterium]|nr:YHS domain-containing protein [Nitrospirota bacterium]
MKTKPQYGYSKTLDYAYEDVLVKVTEELKKEGFGVITEIDVKETLKKKLGVDFKKYKILGASHPRDGESMCEGRSEREVIEMAKDPVCGMQVDEKKSAGSSRNKGRTYYFCSTSCKGQFEKDPEKFLKDTKK